MKKSSPQLPEPGLMELANIVKTLEKFEYGYPSNEERDWIRKAILELYIRRRIGKSPHRGLMIHWRKYGAE